LREVEISCELSAKNVLLLLDLLCKAHQRSLAAKIFQFVEEFICNWHPPSP
jgi:hypothetical protein